MATIKDHEQKAALEGISFDDEEESPVEEDAAIETEATEVEEKEE